MKLRTQVTVNGSRGAGVIRWVALLAVAGLCVALAARITFRGASPRPQASAAPPPPAVVVTPAIEGTVPVYDESVAQTVAVLTVELRAAIWGTLVHVFCMEETEVLIGQ